MVNIMKNNGPDPALFSFGKIMKGTFLERPNRFIVRCLVDGRPSEAYLPNPGKLQELLLPGRTLYLAAHSPAPGDRSPYLCLAVQREGRPVWLHTHWTNQVVAKLLELRRIPGLEDARIVKREIRIGHSRFDFQLDRDGKTSLLEVKSCTLFGRRIAMFPDAVTARGRRHLMELAHLGREGMPGGVLFLVSSSRARWFLPDYHTDIEFAQTFMDLRRQILFKAISVDWRDDLSLGPRVRELAVPWDLIEREARDSGAYLLVLRLDENRLIDVGGLGPQDFRKGYYLYAGSARSGLRKRIERHLRKRKNFSWHIDFLRDHADGCTAIPIRASAHLEHQLAAALSLIAGWRVPGFGVSDCDCESHLFGMPDNPFRDARFISLLQWFRIDRLEAEVVRSTGISR